MSLALTTFLALIAGGAAPAEAPSYAMAPLSRAAPPLHRAHVLLKDPDASPKTLSKARAELDRWNKATNAPADTRRISWWLDGLLSLRLGDIDTARRQRDRLAVDNSTLADPLRNRVAAHSKATPADRLERIHVCPRTLSFRAHCGGPVRQLIGAGHGAQVAPILNNVLNRPMHRARRNGIMELYALSLSAAGNSEAAKRVRFKLWWRTGDREQAPSEAAWWARRVLTGSSVRKLKEAPISKGLKKVLLGVLESRSKRGRRRAHSKVTPTKYATAFSGENAVYAWFALAQIRRRVDADLEAVDAYREVFQKAPDHPLADMARREAAWLSLRRGLPSDSRRWFFELAESSRWGAPYRDGLWYDGLNAFTDGDYERALARFTALAARYGGQREAYRLSWGARATYWRARAQQELGRTTAAARGFSALFKASPATWYGMLGRQQLQAMADKGQIARFVDTGISLAGRRVRGLGATSEAKVVCRPELDLAIAFGRLGEDDRSTKELEAVRRTGQLRDTARAQLADFRAASGAISAAKRLLVADGAWTRKPSRKERAIYREAFPFRYRRTIKRLARRGEFPSAMLAGLVYVESRFNPRARSIAGATGLTQLMYGTAKAVSKKLLRRRLRKRDLYRSRTNLRIGSRSCRSCSSTSGETPRLRQRPTTRGTARSVGGSNDAVISRQTYLWSGFLTTKPEIT